MLNGNGVNRGSGIAGEFEAQMGVEGINNGEMAVVLYNMKGRPTRKKC